MLQESQLLEKLERLWPADKPWCLLGDAAYARSKRLVRPARRSEKNFSAQTESQNRALGRIRVAVEWAFGASGFGVASRFEGVVNAHAMRGGQRPISSYMFTAVLLSNMLVCDTQTSPVAQYFGFKLQIPSLEAYMAVVSSEVLTES